MSVLEFDSILLTFDTKDILSNVAVKCSTGEVVGILGRNGSGKSSLMKIVSGALKATYKSVRIDNSYRSKQITYLPQDSLIPNYIKIRKALSLYGVHPHEIEVDFPEASSWFDLYPGELSGGSRRILEVLLILRSNALFCLLDEPFTGIAPLYIEKLKQIIRSTNSKGIIITDHLYRDVMSITDRLYVLSNGQTYPVKDQSDLKHRGYVF